MKYFKEKYSWESSYDFETNNISKCNYILWKAKVSKKHNEVKEGTAFIYTPLDGTWERVSHLARIYNPDSVRNFFTEITEEEAARIILFGLADDDEECEDEIL